MAEADPVGGHPARFEDVDHRRSMLRPRVEVDHDGRPRSGVRHGGGAEDFDFGVVKRLTGADLSDDPGADVRAVDPFVEFAREFVGDFFRAHRSDAFLVRVGGVEAAGGDDVESGLGGEALQKLDVPPDARRRHVDEGPAPRVGEALHLGDGEFPVVEFQIVAERVGVFHQEVVVLAADLFGPPRILRRTLARILVADVDQRVFVRRRHAERRLADHAVYGHYAHSFYSTPVSRFAVRRGRILLSHTRMNSKTSNSH